MKKDFAFEMAASAVRFGVGVTREVGMDLQEMGATLVLVVTDPTIAKLPPVATVIDRIESDQRHLVGAGAAHGDGVSGPRVSASVHQAVAATGRS
jgi:alcohol dehydrogenase class IV